MVYFFTFYAALGSDSVGDLLSKGSILSVGATITDLDTAKVLEKRRFTFPFREDEISPRCQEEFWDKHKDVLDLLKKERDRFVNYRKRCQDICDWIEAMDEKYAREVTNADASKSKVYPWVVSDFSEYTLGTINNILCESRGYHIGYVKTSKEPIKYSFERMSLHTSSFYMAINATKALSGTLWNHDKRVSELYNINMDDYSYDYIPDNTAAYIGVEFARIYNRHHNV
jgi:hypothetical protein